MERAQQQSSSYSINVAASNVVLQRQRSGDSLAGADVGSVFDPVSDPLPHGLVATVEKKDATSAEGHITSIRDALLGM